MAVDVAMLNISLICHTLKSPKTHAECMGDFPLVVLAESDLTLNSVTPMSTTYCSQTTLAGHVRSYAYPGWCVMKSWQLVAHQQLPWRQTRGQMDSSFPMGETSRLSKANTYCTCDHARGRLLTSKKLDWHLKAWWNKPREENKM